MTLMKVNILASGSGGNCIAIRSGQTTILVDVGIAKTKIEKRLLEVGIRANEIDAIFITHAHADHVKGLPLANKYRIPVYASEGEWKDIKGVNIENQKVIKELIEIGKEPYDWIDISAFKTHHDAYDPVGYVVESQDEKLSICLDTGKVDNDILEMMSNSDIYIIEANHDEDMVTESNYPISVQTRILSHVGHLSNQQTAEALSKLVRGKGEQIYLTHLSSKNNLPALAKMTVRSALEKKGFKAGKHFTIEVV